MGNAESGPAAVNANPSSEHHNSFEESSTDSSGNNDDWDHEVPVNWNENLSPNHNQRRPVVRSFRPVDKTFPQKKQQEELESSPRRRVQRDPEEDRYSYSVDDSSSEDSSSDDDSDEQTATSALMEASAAVFHMLMTADSDSGFGLSEDVSISDRSAAVFEHLYHESKSGNEEPMRQFLGTAQAVSDVLLKEEFNREPPAGRYDDAQPKRSKKISKGTPKDVDGNLSVSQQRAAIFEALQHTSETPRKSRKDNSRRSPNIFQWLETKNDQDAQSVISEMSEGIFKIMDETKGKVDEDSVSEFSAALSKLLDDGQKDGNRRDGRDDDDSDARSISERSAAIFKVLDKTVAPDVAKARVSSKKRVSVPSIDPSSMPNVPSLARPSSVLTGERSLTSHLSSHLQSRCDPSKLMQRNIFHILAQRTKQSIPAVILEDEAEDEVGVEDIQKVDRTVKKKEKEEIQEVTVVERKDQDRVVLHVEESPRHARTEEQRQLPEFVEDLPADTSSKSSGMTEPVALFSDVIHADSSEQDNYEAEIAQEEIDMVFVERFDNAFNNFIGRHPKFLLNNPQMVHNLRITKLQKLLKHMDDYESSLVGKIAKLKGDKSEMESNFQYDLREASREKAELQIALQAQLAAVAQKANFQSAKLFWKVVNSSEARAKKQYIIRQNQKKKRESFAKNNASGIPTREELLTLLPNDTEGMNLKATIHSQRKFLSFQKDDEMELEELRKFQVENAFMSSEIAVLKRKLESLQSNAKRVAWVDSILLRMDKVHMAKLKNKYCSKLGVANLE